MLCPSKESCSGHVEGPSIGVLTASNTYNSELMMSKLQPQSAQLQYYHSNVQWDQGPSILSHLRSV